MPDETYDYIVVGSGAGGGPLAANLAVKGFRVCLIEAGGDPETFLYQVPCFHALATEEKEMAWNYFVNHYDSDPERDEKYRREHGGVLYPRAGTLGGCTAHNAMITVVPHDSDWEHIADLTGDESWRAQNMWQYFQRVERCTYDASPESGHGYEGWLRTSKVDRQIALGDLGVATTMLAALRGAARRLGLQNVADHIGADDPNDRRNRAAVEGLTTTIPLATDKGRRNGAREFVKRTLEAHPDRLTLKMHNLATRVILDGDKRAIGVECREGKNLYRADPSAGAPQYTEKTYRCTREVILAGGAFNTPQLLMLSGIGPKEHLASVGIECLVDRPGVGSNLQDRYEVGVVSEMRRDFFLLRGATFKPPGDGVPPDSCFVDWQRHGTGVYTSNGAMAALILKSDDGKADPDLFIFALPGDFHGYYPTYSVDIEKRKNRLTWAVVKAHTNNSAGTVRLKSKDPLETPRIDFRYFEESNDPAYDDLASILKAVLFIRDMNRENRAIARELLPGPEVGDADLGQWIRSNAWGHHASCSCPMGKPDDPKAVVDSRFRVIGTKGLRIVDASVFSRIPGFFIVTPIYMISEKAAEVIAEDAAPLTHA